MNTLIAVGGINALFLALLVQTKRHKILPDHVLSLFLLLASTAFALVFGALEYGRDGLLLFLVFSNLLYAPLLYLYVLTMVGPEYRWPRRFFWHFVPLALSVVYLLNVLVTRTDADITLLFQVRPFARWPLLFNAFFLLDLSVMPLYAALSWRLLRRHQRQIADRYSYRRSVDHRWLQRLVIAVGVTWVVIDLSVVGSRLVGPLTERQSLTIGFSLATLLVFYLGYHGFRQAAVYGDSPEPESARKEGQPVPRYRKSGLAADEARVYQARLLAHMEADHPHLDSSMSIRDLADAVGLSEHNTSEVINAGLGKSFYDFVNGYRVEEFKRLVKHERSAHLTLLALALDAGFNSKSSFNRIFKQQTGVTPTAYRKSRGRAAPIP